MANANNSEVTSVKGINCKRAVMISAVYGQCVQVSANSDSKFTKRIAKLRTRLRSEFHINSVPEDIRLHLSPTLSRHASVHVDEESAPLVDACAARDWPSK